MKKYLRLLVFGKPYLGAIGGVLALTYVYIFFNMATYWFSADFVKTLFLGAPQTEVVAKTETVSPTGGAAQTEVAAQTGVAAPAPKKAAPPAGMQDMIPGGSIKDRIKSVTEGLVSTGDRRQTLLRVCVVLLVCFVLKNIAVYFKGILMGFVELRIINDIRDRMFDHLVRLPLRFYNNRKSGEITSIMINDVGVINNVISTSFKDFILVPSEVAVQFVLLWLISWKLTLYTLIVIPAIAFIIVQIGNSVRRKSKRTLEGIAGVIDCLQEVMPNIKIVKAFVTERKERDRFRRLNRNYFALAFRQKKLQNITTPVNEVIGASLAVFLLWFGGNQVLSGAGLSADDFIRYLILLFAMFQPLRTLSGLNNTIQTGVAAGERVFEILQEPAEPDEGKRELVRFGDSIRFEHVTFGYAPGLPLVLRDVSFAVRKGEVAAFVGPSGAGKTTLVNLIPRFYELAEGRILMDGIDVREYTLASLRRQIGVVTQETILFNMSIAENIAYAGDAVDMARVAEAARVANAEGFILQAPGQYATVVGERGVRLSGGQKQRLSIARAMLTNTPILILDEATSSLDTESEKLVQEAIDSLMKNRTVLAIAHRLSTVIHADTIVVLDQGRIVDAGPHRRLLDRCPLYRKLYDMQFRDESAGAP
jgi:ATP-binding cassette, subfamily B, bacterial MsbA